MLTGINIQFKPSSVFVSVNLQLKQLTPLLSSVNIIHHHIYRRNTISKGEIKADLKPKCPLLPIEITENEIYVNPNPNDSNNQIIL